MTQPVAAGSTAVPAPALARWAADCLQALDMPAGDAGLVADSLVQTSLWGIDSHGIARLPHYLERLRRGSIVAEPSVAIERSGPCTAQVNGGHGHGIVIAHRAVGLATELARESGIGAVGVANSSHCGAMALYTRPPARDGLVALAFTHADPMAVPHGGVSPFFGTNPISIAFPRHDGEPVCLDMATTSIPWNRVMNARREGHPLPPGTALDETGAPTTDAEAARALLPLGGLDYGHKGYGLALMVDLLCGPLQGNPWGPLIPGMFTALDERRRIGAFFIVIDPGRFFGGPTLPDQVALMARELGAERGSPRVPGDPELAAQTQRLASGIPIEPMLARQIHEWSERLCVAPLRTL